MRKIIVSNVVTLDGYFEGPDKEIDWFMVSEGFFAYARKVLENADTLLYGRITYELMLAFWPNATDQDPVITEKMNSLPKIVFSNTLKKVEWGKWNNARLVNGNILDEITQLKQQPGKDIVILGSGTLVSQLSQYGLIDEYRIIVNPLILGKGNLMFKDIDHRIGLTLLKTEILDAGVVVLYYQLANV